MLLDTTESPSHNAQSILKLVNTLGFELNEDRPVPSHECPDGWRTPFDEADVFCRMCGTKLIEYRIEPEQVVLATDGLAGASASISLGVSQQSIRSLHVLIECSDPGLIVESEAGSAFQIEPGQLRTWQIRVDGRSPSDSGGPMATMDRPLMVRLLAPTSRQLIGEVPVYVGRPPEFAVELAPFPPLRAGGAARIQGRLRHLNGLPAVVQSYQINPDAFTVEGFASGQRLSSGEEVAFWVGCDSSRLSGPGDHVGSLEIDWRPAGSVRTPIPVHVQPPPRLSVSAATPTGTWQVPTRLLSEVALSLRNIGGDVLTVVGVAASGLPDWFRIIPTPGQLPAPLRGGKESAQIRCEIDGDRLGPGRCSVDVVATLSDGEHLSFSIPIVVTELKPYKHFVGIDFGTTNSCVAYYFDPEHARDGGRDLDTSVRMVLFRDRDGQEHTTVPSTAYFDQAARRWYAGFDAERMAAEQLRPDCLVHSVKRLMNEVRVDESGAADRSIEVAGELFDLEIVAAHVFKYLKAGAERQLKAALDRVMITVPANFTDTGIQALLRAAREAGLTVFQTRDRTDWHRYRLDEPTAAAIDSAKGARAPAKGGTPAPEKHVLVFDFGGGTLDVSILRIYQRLDLRCIEVLAHKGANWLGGDDFTVALTRLLASRIRTQEQVAIKCDLAQMKADGTLDHIDQFDLRDVYVNDRLLWEAAEHIKISLSTHQAVHTPIRLRIEGDLRMFSVDVTRDEFEALVNDLVTNALKIVDRAIVAANRRDKERGDQRKLTLKDMDEVIASGRTSLIPLVERRLLEHCKRTELHRYPGFDHKECVARGACWYGVDNLELVGSASVATLDVIGIHEITNCSYGVGNGISSDIARHLQFKTVIPEGTVLGPNAHSTPKTFPDESATVNQEGGGSVWIYQHTGDPTDPSERVVAGNRDIVPIDTIEIHGVSIADRRKPPRIKVEMWIDDDGLLEAQAEVSGHPTVFRLQHRFRG